MKSIIILSFVLFFLSYFTSIMVGQATTHTSVILDNGAANPFIRFDTPNGAGQFLVGFNDEFGVYINNSYKFFIKASAQSFQMVLDGDGTTLKGDLTVEGEVEMASSRSLKENISQLTIAESSSALEMLDPVKFNYIRNPDEQVLGFIAEDVPDLVACEGRQTINTMDIVAVLTKVVKDQQRQIEELKKRMELFESRE